MSHLGSKIEEKGSQCINKYFVIWHWAMLGTKRRNESLTHFKLGDKVPDQIHITSVVFSVSV